MFVFVRLLKRDTDDLGEPLLRHADAQPSFADSVRHAKIDDFGNIRRAREAFPLSNACTELVCRLLRSPAETLTHPARRAADSLSRTAGEGAERSEAGEGDGRQVVHRSPGWVAGLGGAGQSPGPQKKPRFKVSKTRSATGGADHHKQGRQDEQHQRHGEENRETRRALFETGQAGSTHIGGDDPHRLASGVPNLIAWPSAAVMLRRLRRPVRFTRFSSARRAPTGPAFPPLLRRTPRRPRRWRCASRGQPARSPDRGRGPPRHR